MKTKLIALTLVAALFGAPIIEAKPSSSRSGGFSSSSSRSSGSKSSGSWGSSSKNASNNSSTSTQSKSTTSKPNTAQAQTNSRPTSNVDRAKYESAVKQGKSFTSREKAVQDFKQKSLNKYPTKFDKEPTKRPDYIPTKYRDSGGVTREVVYHNGGYGHWSGGGTGLGTFMLLDFASDALLMNALMDREGYHVGSAPVVHQTSYSKESNGFATFMKWVIGGFIVCALGAAIIAFIYGRELH